MFFDTHAHYDDEKFSEDRFDTIETAHKSGVSYITNVASNLSSAYESITLSKHFSYVYATIGIHPHNVNEIDSTTFSTLYDYSKHRKVVAIGEIGLDYYHKFSTPALQKRFFIQQISLAKELNLPIIVHDRDAHKDSLDIINSESARLVGGIFHCFSGSKELARDLLRNDFYISIAGPVTYKNVKNLIDVVNYVPLDRLLIETDSPYLAPEPNRGKRNDSSQLKFIAEKIAAIKGESIEKIAQITTENALTVFQIQKNVVA